ncbi:Retrovirus-related Pol polyprotein from transposon TNT 1-94 [Trichinella zimbabwensis]|uniref:Retrovirus-related Pol polyprotein from transposon TNT 1-94 n=1 Tax=Trichinella zimbabwensis TaxID=268475 RepID=A0A0V1GQ65_9BILA|nr:Retrovirus-related Pol polyprotein from transposon TNT 1-94 [Trichinella zimbabwensis]
MQSEKVLIQLNGENYSRWKFEIEAVLEARDCLDVVSGETICPQKDESEIKAWKRRDALARSIISRSLDDFHHAFIHSCKTSKEMMNCIVRIKEQATVSSKLLVSSEFHAYTWKPGMNVASFIAGLNVIVNKMQSLQIELDDEIIIGKVIQCLPSDFDSFRQSWRLSAPKTSPPYTPQCNGMAERENRTLVEKARSMLHARNLPRFLWAEAVHTAAYLLNRIPNRKETTKTPYEKWFGKRPTVEHLRIFGCDAYVHIPDQHRNKFDRKARKVIFVGYGLSNKMFRVFDTNKHRVDEVTDVKFNESLQKRLVLIDGEEEMWMQTADKDEDNFHKEDIPDHKTEKRGPGRPPGSRNKIKVISNPLKMELRSKSTERTAMLAAADPLTVLKELVKKPDAEYEITVRDPSNFVGLEIYQDRSKRTIAIGQKNYIRRVLLKFNMENCK